MIQQSAKHSAKRGAADQQERRLRLGCDVPEAGMEPRREGAAEADRQQTEEQDRDIPPLVGGCVRDDLGRGIPRVVARGRHEQHDQPGNEPEASERWEQPRPSSAGDRDAGVERGRGHRSSFVVSRSDEAQPRGRHLRLAQRTLKTSCSGARAGAERLEQRGRERRGLVHREECAVVRVPRECLAPEAAGELRL